MKLWVGGHSQMQYHNGREFHTIYQITKTTKIFASVMLSYQQQKNDKKRQLRKDKRIYK